MSKGESFGLMVIVTSGMFVIASVGLFGLWWVTLRPFFNWLF